MMAKFLGKARNKMKRVELYNVGQGVGNRQKGSEYNWGMKIHGKDVLLGQIFRLKLPEK